MSRLVKMLTFVFGIITLLICLCLLYICIEIVLSRRYSLDISVAGITNFQDFWSQYAILLKGFAGCATIFIAGYNLNKYIEVTRIDALARFRSMLNDEGKKSLHWDIMNSSDQQLASRVKRESVKKQLKHVGIPNKKSYTSVDVLDYIGVIELGAIMLKKGIISFEEFYNQFGYRVEYILKNGELRNHIKGNMKYYEDFLYVVNEMVKHGMIEEYDFGI